MQQDSFYILTGAMGAGKSTVLAELEKQGINVVPEPARQILKEQRAIGGSGVYDKDAKLFCELMLSRAIGLYHHYLDADKPVVFDRGIADNIAYLELFGFDCQHASNAAKQFRYNTKVLVLPGWEAIYQTDDERTMSFEQAKAFGDQVSALYEALGYDIIEVPQCSPKARSEFILKQISC